MLRYILVIVPFAVLFTNLDRCHAQTSTAESGPIIGVLAEEVTAPSMINRFQTTNTSSFISAAYIKWIESAGGRAVPIILNQPDSYYTTLLSKINGLVFPGGSASIFYGMCAKTGKLLYQTAQQMNQQGNYFPIWGTCLGFEMLSSLTANRGKFLSQCEAENVALPVQFVAGFQSSKMLSTAPREILDMLAKEPITANNHHKCITPANFSSSGQSAVMRNLATSVSTDGVTFVAIIEDTRYPFYGVQFHPEKPQFESKHPDAGAFQADAVKAGQFFASFLVAEAKKSQQRFPNKEEENKYSISNYNALPAKGTIYNEIYLFK